MGPTLAQLRALIASSVAKGDEAGANSLRREYYTESLAQHIHEVLAKAPPLKDEQIKRLRSLLGGE